MRSDRRARSAAAAATTACCKAVGAPRNVPAVGGAVHTERLLAVVRGGKR